MRSTVRRRGLPKIETTKQRHKKRRVNKPKENKTAKQPKTGPQCLNNNNIWYNLYPICTGHFTQHSSDILLAITTLSNLSFCE